MGISSVPSFSKMRKLPCMFTLTLLLLCLTILLFTKTKTSFPLLFYSDVQTSNPITAPSLQTGAVSDGATIVSVTLNWELCTGWGAVDYIPCLDNFKVIRALKTRRHMERRERHCPEQSPRCLPPLPKGYKVPVPWPKSKDMVRFMFW